MSGRTSALVTASLILLGGALTWVGKPEQEVSMTSVGELWAEVFRDADRFGLQLSRVSAAAEMAKGSQIAGSILQHQPGSAAWQAYVSAVGQRVAKGVQRKDIRYEFHVIDSPTVNAFALPGGQVFIYTGLLDAMKDEAELAGVLGHEIGHVDARHCIERYQYEMKTRKMGLGDAGVLAEVAMVMLRVGYSKIQELEADAIGQRLAVEAGYDPHATVDLFARVFQQHYTYGKIAPTTPLEEMAKLASSVVLDYFQSHPPTPERMRRLNALIAQYVKSHAGQRVYRGAENLQKKIPRTQQEFPAEFVSLS